MNANAAHIFFSPDDWLTIIVRLSLAALAGGVVGLNRDRIKRPAGLRTYMTVSVGSALFVMLTLQAGVDFNATNALSRTVQGITTGVGFIGAGLIFQRSRESGPSHQVKGLTSAAALWLTASLGTAAGCGLWQTTLLGTLLSLVILSGVKRVKDAPVYSRIVRKKQGPRSSLRIREPLSGAPSSPSPD